MGGGGGEARVRNDDAGRLAFGGAGQVSTSDIDAAGLDGWIALRRELHRHPETGFTEYLTASKLAGRLEALGYRVRTGAEAMLAKAMVGRPAAEDIALARDRAEAAGADPRWLDRMPDGMTGLVAELKRGDGPVTAMRFDIDALPVVESSVADHVPARLGFASERPGLMHACGHDGHAAIGIGVAEVAARPDAAWRGTLRLLFQPAEEGGRGGRAMAERGVVDDAAVLIALHLGCDLPSGSIACAATDMMFSAKWDVDLTGRAAHAAGNPEDGRNAVLAAAQAVVGLYALPRHGKAATHVNVGRITGGTARNVIADSATLEIELRGDGEAALAAMEAAGRRLIEGVAAAHGCGVVITEMGRTIGAETSPGLAALIGEVAATVPGIGRVLAGWPLGGGDDAAFLMRRVQQKGGEAAYFILGSDLAAGHHATRFDFREADIGVGVALLSRLLDQIAPAQGPRTIHPAVQPASI